MQRSEVRVLYSALKNYSIDKDIDRNHAKLVQLVERHLAMVKVAGSNPVLRSLHCRCGGTGRRSGLKILWSLTVWVRSPPPTFKIMERWPSG